jgi:hypothetical protein
MKRFDLILLATIALCPKRFTKDKKLELINYIAKESGFQIQLLPLKNKRRKKA